MHRTACYRHIFLDTSPSGVLPIGVPYHNNDDNDNPSSLKTTHVHTTTQIEIRAVVSIGLYRPTRLKHCGVTIRGGEGQMGQLFASRRSERGAQNSLGEILHD